MKNNLMKPNKYQKHIEKNTKNFMMKIQNCEKKSSKILKSQKQQEQIQQQQQQNQKPEIKKDENRKIKLVDIDFNLETLNSKKKKKRKRRKYEESSEESNDYSSADESDYELEAVKKKTKKI